MNIDLTAIIQAIIALCAALITYKLIPWIKNKTTEQQQHNFAAAVKVAVYAAEQIFGSGNGQEKYSYVLTFLANSGFTVDTDAIKATIENAVYELNLDQAMTGSQST